MATTTEQELGFETEDSLPKEDSEPEIRSRPLRNWLIGTTLVFVVIVVLVVSLPAMLGYGGADPSGGATVQRVSHGRLLVTVTEDGNLESASNVEVRCQVAGGGTIIWIIPDGSMVEPGQELVRLDQSVIEDQLNTQKINYERARATKIQADEDYAAASIAVKEYEQGTYLKDVQTAESAIKIAMESMRSAENTLSHTERMFRKGFVTALQLDADKFAVQRSKLDLEAAQTAKKVLQEFTKPKTLKALQATRDAANARTRSEQAALDLEKDKLDRLQKQLQVSIVKAPQRGMVIYANEMAGRRGFSGNQSSTIEEGGVVRERQTLIRLPDLTKMQVKVTVHESKVEMIRPGMPARITVQDRQWVGKVVSVANQPEPGNWFMSSIKEYATIVSIEGDTSGLRPGMTAEVEILIADLHDVLTVPVSAVVDQGGKFFAWVKENGTTKRRPLLLGETNDKVIQIKDGLKDGDEVILNPRAVVPEVQQGAAGPLEPENADRFGSSQIPTGASQGTGAVSPVDAAAADQKGKGPMKGDAKSGAIPNEKSASGEGRRGKKGDSSQSGGPGRSGEGRRRGGGRGGPRMDFATMDKNKDGKVTADEVPEQMKAFFDRIDANHDGAITQAEMQEMRKRMEERRRQRDAEGDTPGAGGGPP